MNIDDMDAYEYLKDVAPVRVVSSVKWLNEQRAFVGQRYSWDEYKHEAQPPMTVADARAMSDAEWLRVPNFGRVSLRELRAFIGKATEDKPVRWDAFKHWAAI